MSLKRLFSDAVIELKKREIPFALAGGLAADLYRSEPRVTMDIDLAIATDTGRDAGKIAADIMESLDLKAGVLRQADLAGGPLFAIKRKSTAPVMLVGRSRNKPDHPGLDLLLPALPWTGRAISRAVTNMVDFGFGDVPALRVEDVILSKLYALQNPDLRAKDLDDLQSIHAGNTKPDLAYISGQIRALKIVVPLKTKSLIPRAWKFLLITD